MRKADELTARRPGQGRSQLLQKVQSREWSPEDRSIDVSISWPRRKLEEDPNRPALIKTIRNTGMFWPAR